MWWSVGLGAGGSIVFPSIHFHKTRSQEVSSQIQLSWRSKIILSMFYIFREVVAMKHAQLIWLAGYNNEWRHSEVSLCPFSRRLPQVSRPISLSHYLSRASKSLLCHLLILFSIFHLFLFYHIFSVNHNPWYSQQLSHPDFSSPYKSPAFSVINVKLQHLNSYKLIRRIYLKNRNCEPQVGCGGGGKLGISLHLPYYLRIPAQY